MTTATVATSDIDLWADEILASPYAAFAKWREQAAAVYLTVNDVWVITRYDALRTALSDWETFSSTKIAFNPQMNEVLKGTSLASDPPLHTTLRATLTENLSQRALAGMKETIAAKADRIICDLIDRGTFDAITDLATELPLQVVLDLIGIQGEVREKILPWGAAAFNLLGPMNQRTQESFPLAGELFEWTHGMDRELLAEGSIGRAIFDAGARGDIPEELCGHIIHQYLAAGMDTTIATIGNVVNLFALHPDQFALVRQDPSLVKPAMREVLRMEAPEHSQGRGTTRDVDVDGTVIPSGSQVAMLYLSGNRDRRHYEDPDEFRVLRNPIDHLGFGYGVHACAGRVLAEMETIAIIEALCRRVSSITVGAGVPKLNNCSRGLASLPVLEIVPA